MMLMKTMTYLKSDQCNYEHFEKNFQLYDE